VKTFAAFRRRWQPARVGVPHPRIEEFVERRLARYADDRDFPARDATSQLSPLIASGEITIDDCAAAALAAPPTRGRAKEVRIFNPERQRERFDSDGAYCARWADGGYPEPMIDLAREAGEAKERYRSA
jgi:deoxyribodipyrimidine photolyase